MTDLKQTKYYGIFVCAWRFMESNINGMQNKGIISDWIKNVKAQSEFYLYQYAKDPFLKKLLESCIDEIQRKNQRLLKKIENGERLDVTEDCPVIKNSRYWFDFQNFWDYFRKYYGKLEALENLEREDILWKEAVNEARALGHSHGNKDENRLLQMLINAAMDEFERCSKQKKMA